MTNLEKGILIAISLASMGLSLYGFTGVLNSFGRKASLGPLLGAIAAAASGYAVNKALGPGRDLKLVR